jgi:hypothetical protein
MRVEREGRGDEVGGRVVKVGRGRGWMGVGK